MATLSAPGSSTARNEWKLKINLTLLTHRLFVGSFPYQAKVTRSIAREDGIKNARESATVSEFCHKSVSISSPSLVSALNFWTGGPNEHLAEAYSARLHATAPTPEQSARAVQREGPSPLDQVGMPQSPPCHHTSREVSWQTCMHLLRLDSNVRQVPPVLAEASSPDLRWTTAKLLPNIPVWNRKDLTQHGLNSVVSCRSGVDVRGRLWWFKWLRVHLALCQSRGACTGFQKAKEAWWAYVSFQ